MRLGKVRNESHYLAIQYYSEKKHQSIRWMCRQLEIAKAAYYKWLHHPVPPAEQENIQIAQLVSEYDARFNHILGYRRMAAWINHFNGMHYSKKRIHRIMKVLHIHSVIRQKKHKYLHSTPVATAENILKRDFNAAMPNEKWATDVTEFKWYDGPTVHKLHLSAILDLYDRTIVAYVVSTRNDNRLVFKTFDKAISENPGAKPLFHSDRGFQYTSKVFQMKLKKQSMTQSMSRVGHCIDNCPAEGFWGIVKAEMFYLNKFKDEATLRAAIDEYISFYNCERLQERFGNRSPMEVRRAALAAREPAQYPIPENKRIQKYKARFAA